MSGRMSASTRFGRNPDGSYNRHTPVDGGPSEYEEWTKDELAAELESRDLAKTGNKAELIARLEEDDAG